jgi:hypothetical protein
MQVITGTVQTIPQQIRGNIKPTIASSGEEYQKGYDEGYEIGKDEGYDGGFADGKEQGFEDGKNSVPDIIRYMRSGQLASLNVFKEPTVVLDLVNWTTTSFLNFLQISTLENANTIVEHLTINCVLPPKSIQQMFYAANNDGRDFKLKHLTFNVDLKECSNVAYAFSGLRALEILDGLPLDFSSATNLNTTFNSLYELFEFRVIPNTIKVNLILQHSSKLSNETIQSIIDGLADLTGQTSQTLTLHSTVYQSLTSEQMLQIMNKNWIPQ